MRALERLTYPPTFEELNDPERFNNIEVVKRIVENQEFMVKEELQNRARVQRLPIAKPKIQQQQQQPVLKDWSTEAYELL